MSDLILEEDELGDLQQIGKPQELDDAQLIAFRTMARAMVKLVKSQRDIVKRLKAVEGTTAKCDETHAMVTKLSKALTPDDAKKHIDVRVDRLEKINTGIWGVVKANAGVIILALILGAMKMLGKL